MPVSGLTFRYQGVAAVQHNLKALGLTLDDLDFRPIARDGMRLAARFAPVRTGKLRKTLRASTSRNRAVVRAGTSKVLYAGAINYGWPARKIGASKFMQRADAVLRTIAPRRLEAQIRAVTAQRKMR